MAAQDNFANLANLVVEESAANTLTFVELNTGTALFEKMAMVVHRIEYVIPNDIMQLMTDASDELEIALVTSNQISGLAKDKAQVIDRLRIGIMKWGTAATGTFNFFPHVHNFSDLPGGGLIIPATNIFGAIKGTSLTGAGYCRMAIYFTYKSLKGEEYWELVEATRALS